LAIDDVLLGYLTAVEQAVSRHPALDHDETELRVESLVEQSRRARYPRLITIRVLARLVRYDGRKLLIRQHNRATRHSSVYDHQFLIPVFRCR